MNALPYPQWPTRRPSPASATPSRRSPSCSPAPRPRVPGTNSPASAQPLRRSGSPRRLPSPTCLSSASSTKPSSLTRPTRSLDSSSTRTTRPPSPPSPASPSETSATGCFPIDATTERLAELAPGLTPEMAAAVSKLMRLQDLVLVARKISRRHKISDHRRPSGTAFHAPPAEPPHGRSRRHRRLDYRRPHAWLRRRRHRHQPRLRLAAHAGRASPACRPCARTLPYPYAKLRPRARHHADGGNGLGAPVDLVFQSIGGTEATKNPSA